MLQPPVPFSLHLSWTSLAFSLTGNSRNDIYYLEILKITTAYTITKTQKAQKSFCKEKLI